MVDQILFYISALFKEETDVPATLLQIVNLIASKIIPFIEKEI